MFKKMARLSAVCAGALLLSAVPLMAQDSPVVIRWFVGLGTGINPDQLAPQEQIVADFNETHDNIELEISFTETSASIDALSTLIASGDAPDIVGPVGVGGSNSFADAWLDLQPLVDSSGYDLTQFDEQAVDFYRVEGQGLLGLPFGVFPSFIGYNKDLFDEAELNYPPAAYGEPYVMPDGTEVEWTIDVMAEIGRMLTVDSEGYAANEAEFNADDVVQYGFSGMFNSARGQGSLFGAGTPIDEAGNAQIPEAWRAAWNWFHEGTFGEQPFIASVPTIDSDEWGNGNSFPTGRIAMAHLHLWYVTCCIGDLENWSIAAMPSYNGTITAKLHADNFRILETTENPEEAFEVLTYLIDERSADLLQIYGGMPARASDQDAFFETLAAGFPEDINWQVAIDGLSYADIPAHEGFMPNINEAEPRLNAFSTLIESNPDVDVDAEIDLLQSDLQAIFDSAE